MGCYDDIKPRITHTKSSITDLGLQKSSAKLWNKGTIILSTSATIGNVGIAMKALTTKQSLMLFLHNIYEIFCSH